MAERRMFAKKITESDDFLDMPMSTQCLYFHLSLNADDEGFVNNPKRVQRTIGANDDDMKLLIAKSFVIMFESGVIVIKHWKIHNYIQSDRFKPTDYNEEKAMLNVKKNKAYTLALTDVDTECIQSVSVGKVSIGKVSIDKDKDKSPSQKHCYGEYNHVRLSDKEYEDLASKLGTDMRDKCITYLDEYIEMKGYKAKSHNLAIQKWVVDAVKKKGGETSSNGKRGSSIKYNAEDAYGHLDEYDGNDYPFA